MLHSFGEEAGQRQQGQQVDHAGDEGKDKVRKPDGFQPCDESALRVIGKWNELRPLRRGHLRMRARRQRFIQVVALFLRQPQGSGVILGPAQTHCLN